MLTGWNEVQPGVYPNIPNEEYHAGPGVSNSGLSLFLKSPKKYWYKYLQETYKENKESDDKKFGSAVHAALLEPAEFDKRYFVTKKIARRGKEWEAILNEAGEKEILFDGDLKVIDLIKESILQLKIGKKLLDGKKEHSIYWIDKDSGVLCRTRPDCYNDRFVLDVKTTRDASPQEYPKSVYNYGYHRQAAMMLDGLEAITGKSYKDFIHLAIEKDPPYLLGVYNLDDDAIEQGRREYKAALIKFRECMEANYWPGYTEVIQDLSLPYWALKIA